jgi:acyl-CoA reductase-like NAD-dependent aldehyde dehydrogenase
MGASTSNRRAFSSTTNICRPPGTSSRLRILCKAVFTRLTPGLSPASQYKLADIYPINRTEEDIITLRGASIGDVDKAVAAARGAFEGEWSELAAVDRGAFLYKIADLIKRDSELLAAIDAFDNGKVSHLRNLPEICMC